MRCAGGGKEGEWAAVYHHRVVWKYSVQSQGGLWWSHSIWICHWLFYIYTWTLGQTLMKIKKTIIFTVLKQSLLLIVPSHDAILSLPAWGRSSLIFELPPETYHNSITQKGEVTLQRRRLHFLALNLMCKHSYCECNHGNNNKKRGWQSWKPNLTEGENKQTQDTNAEQRWAWSTSKTDLQYSIMSNNNYLI